MSRIAAGVQAIDLSRESGLGGESGGDASGSDSDGEGSAGAEAIAAEQQEGAEPQQEAGGDDGDWEVAAKSRKASRRHKRQVRTLTLKWKASLCVWGGHAV